MSNYNKLVSVLIPSYNHEKYVGDCLESVLAQTYSNIEVIICDDKSKDNTCEVIERYRQRLEEKFSRICIIKNEKNVGIVKNCNKLMSLARGDYYKLLASDDMLRPDGIEKLVLFMESHKEHDLVYSYVDRINVNTTFKDLVKNTINNPIKYSSVSGKSITSQLMAENFIVAPSVLIPKETVERWGVFSEEFIFEDWEYWLRVSVDGSIGYLDESTAYYRDLETSASRFTKKDKDRYEKFIDNELKLMDKYKDYITSESKHKYFKNKLRQACSVEDIEYVGKIRNIMLKEDIKVSIEDRLLILLAKLRIYDKVKKGYRKFVKK